MNSDDMETFKVLVDEEVDMMIGHVQDDHRITEPAHDAPRPRSRSRSSPRTIQPAEPVRPAEPIRFGKPIRPTEPARREELSRFDEPVHFEEPVHHDIRLHPGAARRPRPEGAAP